MSRVTWERRYEALKAVHDELSESSLSLFDADMNYGEALRLIRYKGKLYIFVSPWGQVWAFDGKDWEKVYDVGEKHGRNTINPADVYSKWAMTAWDACHFSVDDKLYFAGIYIPDNGPTVLRYSKTADEWEFINLLTQIGEAEFLSLKEFNGYLYGGFGTTGEVWRSQDGLTWTKVFNQVPSFNYVHALGVGGSPMRIWAGLSQQENGNMTNDRHGKIHVSQNGVDWNEELDLPNSGGVSALGPGVGEGTFCVAGTNYGHVYLWDGGFQAWRKIGRVGMPILDIRQHSVAYPMPDWLVTCGSRYAGVAGGGGAIWRVTGGRLLQVLREYSHAIFSHEVLNGDLFYSWGWADVVSTTHIRGHYAGVKRIRETFLDYLTRQNQPPMYDTASKTTTDSPAVLIYFNLGSWRNRVLRLKNSGANNFRYRVEGSDDSVAFITLGDYDGPQPGYAPVEIDFSESPYGVIRIMVWSANSGQSTTVETTIQCW